MYRREVVSGGKQSINFLGQARSTPNIVDIIVHKLATQFKTMIFWNKHQLLDAGDKSVLAVEKQADGEVQC